MYVVMHGNENDGKCICIMVALLSTLSGKVNRYVIHTFMYFNCDSKCVISIWEPVCCDVKCVISVDAIMLKSLCVVMSMCDLCWCGHIRELVFFVINPIAGIGTFLAIILHV